MLNKLQGHDVKVVKEYQDRESERFKKLFAYRGGPSYIQPIQLKRQINLRDDTYKNKLYKIKGKKFARVVQVPLATSELNSGDVFVLDNNEIIYQWTGKKSNRMEKGRALDLTKRLRDERMNRVKADVIIESEGQESEDFWKLLGGKADVLSVEEGGDDEQFELKSIEEDLLYCVSNNEGAISIDKLEREEMLHRKLLEPQNSYIIDSHTQIFVWNGSTTTVLVRQEAVDYAQSLLKTNGRPDWVEVTVTANGAEPALFKMKFKGLFEEYVDTPAQFNRRLADKHKIAREKEEKVNIDALLHPEKYANEKEDEIGYDRIIDAKNPDDLGEMTVYIVKNKERVEIPQKEYGLFYSGESYICHYTLRIPGSITRHVVYFWQGRRASIESKGSSALLATSLASKVGRNSIHVRVVQGKEPEHFLSHFEGFMRVRLGEREAWRSTFKGQVIFYQIRGETAYQARAIQMINHASNLSSNDIVLLEYRKKKTLTIWKGKCASEHSVEYLNKYLPKYVKSTFQVSRLDEGQEGHEFWSLFPSGRSDYAKMKVDRSKMKFFICRRRPHFKVVICEDWAQEDLLPRSVCIVDAFNEVFLWASKDATNEERRMSTKTASEYIKQAQDGRSNDCPLYNVEDGFETFQFTGYFQGWDHGKNEVFVPVVARPVLSRQPSIAANTMPKGRSKKLIRRESSMAVISVPKRESAKNTNQFNPEGLTWDHDRLKVRPPPDGVDILHLEAFLSVEEFHEIFGMDIEQFYKLPRWKQLVLKKEKKLF